jgi:hypothetical protein
MDNLSPQQIQQMIQLLQSMLPESSFDQTDDTDEVETVKKQKPAIKPKAKKVKKERENKFDEMNEKFMHKEDIAIDRKLITQPPVPRARKFKMADTMCRVCGKKEKVNPVLITESGYKCNKCSGSPG